MLRVWMTDGAMKRWQPPHQVAQVDAQESARRRIGLSGVRNELARLRPLFEKPREVKG